ncbi:30S ribosomal protein S20 [Candidatus Peregrinibacteria bacterium]|nr:30S ribosomal protein S20 [Candidatus Peregrinibacteria bacterium]
MPIIKSAKKQMRQSRVRRAQNFTVRSELKTLIKKELGHIKDGNLEEAVKFLPKVYSVIDMACKKKIIHSSNADRKKSRLARLLNELQQGGGQKVEKKAEPKAKKAVKKVEKVEEAMAEEAVAE